MTRPLVFDDFAPGARLGERVEPYGDELAARWRTLFGGGRDDAGARDAEAAGIAVVLMMRAYLGVVAPRPPGNVHARQRIVLARLPQPGEAVRTVVRCVGKELRRGRRWVELQASGSGDGGRPLYDGRLTLIWAA